MHQEEYYPDPLWRIIGLIATFVVVLVLIVFTVAVAIFCEICKKQLEPLLGDAGMVALILGANIQAALILLFRWLAKQVTLNPEPRT